MSAKEFIPASKLINLTQKKAIVTGGAVSIGLAISYRLAEAGATILIVDKDGDRAQKASQELGDYGYEATFVQCDVSQEKAVQRMVNTAVEKMGSIDILVNNAGIYSSIPLAQMSGDDFEQMLSVNLKGPFCAAIRLASG